MHSLRILLVDDEADIVELWAEKLMDNGHRVHCVFSGNQAVEALQSKEYDLVLTDINMPDGNGLAVFEFMKQRQDLTRMAFITGHGKGDPLVAEAEKSGVRIFNKPLVWSDLNHYLNQISIRTSSRSTAGKTWDPLQFTGEKNSPTRRESHALDAPPITGKKRRQS